MLKRLKSGLIFAVAFGIGAGVGASIYSSDPNTLFKAVFGAVFWGFVVGLFFGGSSKEEELEAAKEQNTIKIAKSDRFVFGLLRILRGFAGLLFGFQLLGLIPVLTWFSNPSAIDGNMMFILFIKVSVMLVALAGFILLKKYVHKLHLRKYGEPHPSLTKALAL